MNAKPRLTLTGELRTIPARDHMLVIECEVVNPPSSTGRTVYVFFNVEEVPKLIAEARSAAIRARSQPMSSA